MSTGIPQVITPHQYDVLPARSSKRFVTSPAACRHLAKVAAPNFGYSRASGLLSTPAKLAGLRAGQAEFLRYAELGRRSCGQRWHPKAVDCSDGGLHHRPGQCDLGKLQRNCVGVADDVGADPDQLELKVRQRPIRDRALDRSH